MNIYDIAQKAGVSAATVSRVINNKNVSEKSKNKVKRVMEQEGYIPNVFARGLNLNSIKTVGILCPVIDDINHAKAVSIIERVLRKNGFDSLLCCTGSNEADKSKYLNLLVNKRVDAVVVIGSLVREINDDQSFKTAAEQVPIVIINGFIKLPNVYCILCDEETVIAELVSNLCERKHRDILYIADSNTYSACQKLNGYKQGLAACGIPENKKLFVKVAEDGNVIRNAYQKVKELIQDKVSFSAVVGADDTVAVGALKALCENNIRIPVIGFNNSEFSLCTIPSLTSVDNRMDLLCATAIDVLMDVFKGKEVASKMVFAAKLVERETFSLT